MMKLRKTTKEDLEILFVFQTNEKGIWMAAFMGQDPNDKKAYMEKWAKIIENPDIRMRTLWMENKIVGSVVHFEMFGGTNVSYWIDQACWGKGIAIQGLKAFVDESPIRPLYGRVAFDNYGSQKVLERCGFKQIEKERAFARARNTEIEEFVYRLE
ncbi:MAG: GNAT family N-acetyltransferase [Bacteroidia bacterium]|nr:GNAT family N-acetyltransferase [Bacteroidia bacterium]